MVDAQTGDRARGQHHRVPLRRWQLSTRPELLWCAAALVVAVCVELIVAWFIRSKGVNLTGDEPSYIIQAQAYAHFTPHILSTIKSDLGAHSLSAYPIGAPISEVASFPGPRGTISPFEPGLGLLLVPFVATGRLFLGAVVGMLVLNTLGLIFIHRRMTYLASLGRRAQFLLALILVAPALLLASTQIYPDLLTGVLLACAVVEIAIIERNGRSNRLNSVVVAIVAAYLPWLQVKNFLVAIVLLAAYVIAKYRTEARWRTTAAISAVCLVSWGLLLGYNQLYFGHLLGLPEAGPGLGSSGVEYTLGLLFDRDQGLFVQLPFVVIGLLGLWIVRKKLPVAVVATVLSVGGILVLNGTYTSNPYGGLSLAGRFMWTAIPVLIVWGCIAFERWQQVGRLCWGPIIVVVGAWVYQAVPILDGSHTYYNVFTQTPPWDPGSWPGWWPGANRILPQFDLPGHPLGAPAVAILVALALACILGLATWQYGKPGTFSKPSLATMGALRAIVVIALVLVKPLGPTTTLTYSATELGIPATGGPEPSNSPLVNLQGVPPGAYVLTLSYGLSGSAASGSMVVSCNTSSGTVMQRVTAPLRLGDRSTSVSVQCDDPGTVATQFQINAHSNLLVRSLRLQKAS